MTVLELALIAMAGILLGRPMLDKPFSEDDGMWFHHAVFQFDGVGLWDRGHGAAGYFGIEGMAVLLARLARRVDSRFFYACKLGWYILTALVLYWTVRVAGGGHLEALFAGLCFTAVFITPQSLFFLTYGEHLYLLPLMLSFVAVQAAGQEGVALIALGGMLGAWALQIKITAVFPVAVLWAALPLLGGGVGGMALYAAGALGLTLAPGVMIPLVHGRSPGLYFKTFLAAPRQFLGLVCGKGAFSRVLKRVAPVPEAGHEDFDDGYVGLNHQANSEGRWDRIVLNLRRPVRKLWGVLLLAAVQLAVPDAAVVCWVVLFLAFAAAQQVQQNYFTPHFSPLWLPVAALSGRTLAWGMEDALGGGVAGMAVLLVAAVQAATLALALRKAWSVEYRALIGAERTPIAAMFKAAESVGLWIREHTEPSDRLFVWGDHPAMYLYARRRWLGPASFFLYGHKGSPRYLDWIMEEFRTNPPEYVLFFNYKVIDGWDAEALGRHSGMVYLPVRTFSVEDVFPGLDGGMSFTLHRLSTVHYRHQLLEKARRSQERQAVELLERALELGGGDALAAGHLAVARGDSAESVAEGLLGQGSRPAKAAAFAVLGRERFLRGDGSAADVLQRATALAPDEPEGFLILGEALRAQGRVKEAFVALGKALELSPNSPDALCGLGRILLDMGQPDQGRTLLVRANRIDPLHKEARDAVEELGLSPVRPYIAY